MTAPFDPEETHGSEHEEQLFDDPNSMTWGAADPDFDELLRDRLGPLPNMPTPPYAFERVLVAGRRRRARKVWAGAAAAAFVVMAGTAGTTVALHGGGPGGAVIGEANPRGSQAATVAVTSPQPSAVPTPSASLTATTAATSASAAASTQNPSSSASSTQCHSDDFKLTVSVQAGSSGSTADELVIVLTNHSGHTCTTYGYPGLQTETQSEQLQTTTVTRLNTSSVQKLTVAQGESISTTASFTAAASSSTAGAGCGAPSYYLAVIPPNEQTQIVEPISGGPITVCGNGVLDTTALVMGKNG